MPKDAADTVVDLYQENAASWIARRGRVAGPKAARYRPGAQSRGLNCCNTARNMGRADHSWPPTQAR